ncbi:MAG TPA: response regulator [Burkholderiaceae bacterium]|nr:response regulator [Burkholderiaceae bacterium]
MGKRVLRVAAFGLKPNEQSVLRSISVLSCHSSRAVSFELVADGSVADLFLVDIDHGEAVSRWRASDPQQMRPVIAIETQGKSAAQKVLRRPLLASRLLAALDEVATNVERFGPRTLMPIAPPAESLLPLDPQAAAVPHPRQAVLVVDDSPTVRKQLEIVLRGRDVDTTLVATGEHALDAIAQREFDLVLLDVVLPGTDGYQVCKAIKKGFGAKRTPVVMLTSKSSPFDRLRGSLAGCDNYLVKPVNQADFEAVLTKYLSAGSADGLKLDYARPMAA